ncbi:MAG: hypothetical protein QM702_21420 [Rubrivivax sp.]
MTVLRELRVEREAEHAGLEVERLDTRADVEDGRDAVCRRRGVEREDATGALDDPPLRLPGHLLDGDGLVQFGK